MQKIIALLAIAGLVFALASATQAATTELTSSTQLNLTDREVLAAVNLYDSARSQQGHTTVGEIQGVDFSDWNLATDNDGSPFDVAGGTFTTVFQQADGREFIPPLEFSPVTADNTQAAILASFAGGHFNTGHSATMTFAFGADMADTDVEVQMVGGGIWNKDPSLKGILHVSVDGTEMGTLQDDGVPYLLTFDTATDASGSLVIDLQMTGARWALVMGTLVTTRASPPRGTLIILR